MLVLCLEVELLEPLFPLVGISMGVEFHLMPFDAAVLHIDMTIVLVLLSLTAQLLQSLYDRFCFLGIMNMLGFPLSQLVSDDLIGHRDRRKQSDRKGK